MAVLLAAGLDGIKSKLQIPEPIDQNIYDMSKEQHEACGIASLPDNLAQSLEYLKSDEIIINALGSHLYEHFVKEKEIEWDMFRTQVHPWEREQYMKQY